MRTLRLVKVLGMLCLFLAASNISAQKGILGKVKNKVSKRAEKKILKEVDKELDKVDKPEDQGEEGKAPKQKKEGDGTKPSMKMNKFELDTTFIDYDNIIFFDDFNGEKVGEFPKKWLPVSGLTQLVETEINGEMKVMPSFNDDVTIKPRYKSDNYLGDSFKMELLVYQQFKGNERYDIYLYDGPKKRPTVIYTSAYGVTMSGGKIVRYSEKPSEGWKKIQLSFNQGTLKIFAEGQLMINQPLIDTTEFTHFHFATLNVSPGLLSYVAISKEGLPLYETLVNEGKLVVQDINFAVNSYELDSSSFEILDEIATMMSDHPDVKLSIEGHTDSDGSAASNQTLSENRAQSVKAYLIGKNIDPSRLSSKGFGESKPLDTSSSTEAKAMNRRVEFVLQ